MVKAYMAGLVDIVSSRVKAEIFRLLFGLGKPELHMREIVRQSGLSLGTIQQELKRLTAAGLIKARPDGNRVYFRASEEHPVYEELVALVLKTDGLVGALRKVLDDEGIELAFIFGSIARGESRAESDVDLMILGSVGLRRLSALLSGSAETLGREINPHVMTTDEFRERKKEKNHFLNTVLSSEKLFIKGNADELEAMGG